MNIVPSQLLTWPRRWLLATVAFGGSAVYAWSFARLPGRGPWLPAASAIGVAAGAAWLMFGLVLLAVTQGRPSPLHWADLCLKVMGAGIAVKMFSVVANFAGSPSMMFHLSVLIAANLVMAVVFIRTARHWGMNITGAMALWFGVLNGLFALGLWGLRQAGWYS